MLKWLGKALAGASIAPPEGTPTVWVETVSELLSSVDDLGANARPGLSKDMLSFVLTGAPLSVLHELAQRKEDVGNKLGLLGARAKLKSEEFRIIYSSLKDVPTAVALRWAQILEAVTAVRSNSCRMTMPNGSRWPELLMMHAAEASLNSWSSKRPKVRDLSVETMESLLSEAGLEKSALIAAAFGTSASSGYGAGQRLQMVKDLDGYGAALERHAALVRPLLLSGDVPQRLHVLTMLDGVPSNVVDLFAIEICELATSSSKQVRTAADPVIRNCGSSVFTPLRRLSTDAKPDQRAQALRLLASLASERNDAQQLAFARDCVTSDKAPSVRALLKEWEGDRNQREEAAQQYEYTLPEIDWSASRNSPDDRTLQIFWREVDESIRKANKNSEEHHARMQAQGKSYPLRQIAPFTSGDRTALRDFLASDKKVIKPREGIRTIGWQHASAALQGIAAEGLITAVAILKILLYIDLLASDGATLTFPAVKAFNLAHRKTGRPTLLELSQMFDAVGLSGVAVLNSYCAGRWGQGLGRDWPNEDVWPYFAHHIDYVVQALQTPSYGGYSFDRSGLFRAIGTMPTPPAAAINALFALALGPGKSERVPAQEALNNLEGKESRIVAALADGKADTRAVAAQWLGKLQYKPALAALEEAVGREKQDLAKGAILDALQSLGQSVEKYLDRDSLDVEATKSLGKGIPKDLEWFPWEAMPQVKWADNQHPVSKEVLRWMVAQAVKQKLPEPNAVLRKYCAMFDLRDRERFGQFILETWLSEDVRPIPPEDAMARAKANAQGMHQSMARTPHYYQDSPHLGKSVEELVAFFLPGFMRQPQGSAIATKGLLALVGACAGAAAAAPTQRYLKEWYGSRAAQGKALIAMLAWIEHPSATQLMLAIGSRFRTKSFQEEATRQAEALAERKGWTLAELADRTVPTAGFDEIGAMELSYGHRSFSARLLPDFKVDLCNPEGKKIASLPEPRQDDDAELAKEAKAAFSAAKKALKGIVDLQTARLYEALCTEREWSYADWHAYLQQHPVLRHLVQRLVWVRTMDGKVAQTFRPLDDGTLTDNKDEQIQLPDDARIRLAHDSLLSPEEIAAWQQHLADYEVPVLFQQLGKGTYALPQDKRGADEIKDFEGFMIEAFALRGRALKLGYTRGAAEDGGWFHVYEKRFPTMGMQAVIEFTGNPLPEENRKVSLLNLSFSHSGSTNPGGQGKMTLSEVPKVLLSECYNDLRLIAAEGTGFDADWQKKSEY